MCVFVRSDVCVSTCLCRSAVCSVWCIRLFSVWCLHGRGARRPLSQRLYVFNSPDLSVVGNVSPVHTRSVSTGRIDDLRITALVSDNLIPPGQDNRVRAEHASLWSIAPRIRSFYLSVRERRVRVCACVCVCVFMSLSSSIYSTWKPALKETIFLLCVYESCVRFCLGSLALSCLALKALL